MGYLISGGKSNLTFELRWARPLPGGLIAALVDSTFAVACDLRVVRTAAGGFAVDLTAEEFCGRSRAIG
jgi:hypothetical protein